MYLQSVAWFDTEEEANLHYWGLKLELPEDNRAIVRKEADRYSVNTLVPNPVQPGQVEWVGNGKVD
jgi:hypothetical protein